MTAPVITRAEYLELHDNAGTAVPFPTPAWRITNMEVLYDGPDVRYGNEVVAGVAGTSALPIIAGESHRVLEIVVLGAADQYGTPYTSAKMGVRLNLLWLADHLKPGTWPNDVTRAATLHLPDGMTTRTAAVQIVSPLKPGRIGSSNARATLDILIPAGAFA